MKNVILCYHKVGLESEEGRFLNCSPTQLDRHAQFFARRNWPGFLPRDFETLRPKGICFTFDDAYVSAIDRAPDILERYGYRGAFYVVPSLVGQTSSWDGERARPLAHWEAILAVAQRGHEIGNHTWSHPHLAELDLEAQIAELQLAREKLAEYGIDAKSIAFPYGSFNEMTIEAMRTVGLGVGLALGKRPVEAEPAASLPRIVVGFSDSVAKLLYKIYVRPKLP